jgi:hypothetical protein
MAYTRSTRAQNNSSTINAAHEWETGILARLFLQFTDFSMTQHKPTNSQVIPDASQTSAHDESVKTSVPAFKFPFAPANFAPKKTSAQSWQQKGSNARHEKKIGMAPKGTRRSMGKR